MRSRGLSGDPRNVGQVGSQSARSSGETAGLGDSSPSLEIVRSIVALSRALGLDVVAEGVETPQQAQILLAEGVHVAQGFLFARPLSADQCLQMWHTGVAMPQALSRA